ncbi:WD40 repeat domain-containing protein [Sporobolomyces koalae]|uniref:WD40 repeat domain-containing protein n=1 Tax=Sporobolomyces koalae TaxID=500713 RepID=UPI0031808119
MVPQPAPSKVVHRLSSHKGPVHVVAFNSGSSYLLTGGSDRLIKLWNPKNGSEIKSYSGHGYEVLSIACTPDNTRFASSGGDRNVFLWDVMSGEIVRRFAGHLGKINAVCWNDSASILASGSFDTTIRLWDAKSSNRIPIQVLEDSKDSITSIAIKDSLIIAGSVDGSLRTWDVRMGELRKDLFDQPITSLTLSRSSPSLVLVSLLSQPSSHPSISAQPAALHLFDLALGQSLNTYTGHSNSNYRIQSCFSGQAEECVYAGDENGTITSWDVESGKQVGKPVKHGDRSVLGVAMHPKERTMVTCGQDGIVKIWGDS